MARCELVKPLTKIINQMLHTGIFSEQLKISKVLPLHKANDKISLTNYRPFALLPSISKIFECVLLEQLTNHFTDNNLLSPQQYVFRAKHSTELAALNLVDCLTYKLDTGKIPINILYLFVQGKSIPDVEHSLNAELSKITDWLVANNLSLKANKTKFMVFHSDIKQFDNQNYISMVLK